MTFESQKSKPRILVVTPTLGNRASLVKTIESVSSYPNVHHVLTCPCSSIKKVREYSGNRLTIIPERRAEGVYSAVNDILLNVDHSFDWITYINDDDYWLPGMSRLIDCASQTDAELLYGRVNFVDINDRTLASSTTTRFYRMYPYLAARGIYLFTQQAVLLKPTVFKRFNGFDEYYKIQGDNDLWIRMINDGVKCEFVNQICAAYRMHSEQLSASNVGLAERKRMLESYGLVPNALLPTVAMLAYRSLNCPALALRYLKGGRSIKRAAGR